MLKVLGRATSINVRKVLWTCAELGVDHEREDWVPDSALNPNALMPVLVDGDFVLWESNAICRYLCNQAGSALLPADPRARARVEQWMDWQATELNNAWRYAFMALVRGSAAHADPAQIAASVAAWHRHIGILDAQLAGAGPYVAGARLSLADIVIGLAVNRWMLTPMERPHYPALLAYYARLGERPGFQAVGYRGVP